MLLSHVPTFLSHVKPGRTPQPTQPDCRAALRFAEAYDLTKIAKVPPGGAKLITDAAGMDATAIFDPIHPKVGRGSPVFRRAS